ncbi:UNVERIFIED_CONTAM: hypothetical protein FQV15_0013851, partial [Eudyptes pachyrhynchus]
DVARAVELLERLQRSGELPPQKLQALQRVLQSKFCSAIREVYEQLYDTLDIAGSPEIRAHATAKRRVWGDSQGFGGGRRRVLGFSKDFGGSSHILGVQRRFQGRSTGFGDAVKGFGGTPRVFGGAGAGFWGFSTGVLGVEGEQHERAVELLKAAQGSVKLVVRYTPRVLEEMEARFEKLRTARRRQHN